MRVRALAAIRWRRFSLGRLSRPPSLLLRWSRFPHTSLPRRSCFLSWRSLLPRRHFPRRSCLLSSGFFPLRRLRGTLRACHTVFLDKFVSLHAAHDRPIRATKMLPDGDILAQQLTSAAAFRSLKPLSMDNTSGRTMSPSDHRTKKLSSIEPIEDVHIICSASLK